MGYVSYHYFISFSILIVKTFQTSCALFVQAPVLHARRKYAPTISAAEETEVIILYTRYSVIKVFNMPIL